MKTRKGFVSNSSSSSFIVVFPKVPKNAKEVQEIMFHGKEGGLSVYEFDGLSFSQISKIVYNDIKDLQPATKKDLIDLLSQRYHYSPPNSNCTLMGVRSDELGGQWYCRGERFWGTDNKLLMELRDFVIEEKIKENARREKMFRIDREFTSKHKQPKYAYKNGTDPDTKKPYTHEDFKAYEDWNKKLEEHRKNSAEYQALDKEEKESWRPQWEKEDKLRKALAAKDAAALLKEFKGQTIYILEYGDHDGSTGCTMEHGGVFKNLHHIRISQH